MVKYKDSDGKKPKNISLKNNRKPYGKPQLTEYGDIEKLTRGSTGGNIDAHGTRSKK